jgi:cyclopropane-fatty-acyl-phospholipid synthase
MNAMTPSLRATCARQPAAANLVLRLLDGLAGGALAVHLPSGERVQAGAGPLRASVEVRDWRMFEAVLAAGDIGLGESYVAGEWECDDPAALMTLLAANRGALGRAVYGNALALLRYRLTHRLRANTRGGSRRNIAAHYDLGNDFYALWLDPTMSYSSALFEGEAARPLEEAQLAKYRRVLRALGARPEQRILEIGCGWGGFAEVAAREFGCRVDGVTLSERQLEYARARARAGGYAERVRYDLRDYRDLQGRYEHIVSIEMFEAVGERWWSRYFRTLRECLAPGGKALVQTITIADPLFARYRRGTDFIQRHVFPGGMLPAPAAFVRHAHDAGLAVETDLAFGRDYARTLAHWRQRFEAAAAQVRAQGFDQRFLRLWRFYLAYCEAGFAAGSTDVHQYVLKERAS